MMVRKAIRPKCWMGRASKVIQGKDETEGKKGGE